MRWYRPFVSAIPVAFLLAAVPDRSASAVQKTGWYEKAVKKAEAKFEPAEAKPGETVTFKLTVDLNDGYHTYPTVQPDKQAEGMVNVLKFPDPGTVIFVGPVTDPKDFETKPVPELMIKELRECSGTVVFSRKAVVSPKAAPGPAAVKLAAFKLSVCDKTNCFPPKTVPVEAALKVLDGPPVAVEKAYADEVAKALAGK
ncbi:MAG: hypothetical protein JWO38_7303 [Gemmataceae bacterium]|nr:hypothetical protein [Gemmataceae bacterium]